MTYNVSKSVPKFLENESKKVLESIPNPFGTFEKTKYILYEKHKNVYSCTTTVRSDKDCINILKKMLYSRNRKSKKQYFKILKQQGEKIEIIFASPN